MKRRLVSLFIALIIPGILFAGGIKGTIRSSEGPLGYATVFVKELGTGTAANQDGFYELPLPAGTYEIVYQFLGFESQVRNVTIGLDFLTIDIVMKEQAVMLRDVTVRAGKEDPAYTIMRKAIAKAKYHTQQLDSYSANVYIKGAGQLKDYPWLAKRALEKEGIDKDRVFISESVSEIKYTRPSTFEERVISIRSDGRDNNTSPNEFIFGSFYEPIIAETVSPLSPAAFGYYRFEYLGTFLDRTYEVSKIRVTPRSRGDNVVEGFIFIVEDWWSIYSLDLKTTKLGIKFEVNQVYAPIEDKVWLPVSQHFKVEGKFFGFDFEYKYLATVSNYKIELNPELVVEEMEVIDEKLAEAHAKEVEEKYGTKNQELQERIERGNEITRKELRAIIKDYEKQERKELKEPDVISNMSFKIDSAAYKKDSTYWAQIRPVPLTFAELKGYKKTDSLAVIERKKEEGDTVKRAKNNKQGFQPWDLLIGDTYRVAKHSNLAIEFPETYFNTVEGFNLIYRLNFGTIIQDTNRTRFNLIPTFRYAFARETASGMMSMRLRNRKYRLQLDGGRYVKQFSPDEPILPIVNTVSTLFFERNLMKIYERDFVDLLYRKTLARKYTFETKWSWSRRRELFNNTTYKIVNRDFIDEYTPNAPVNVEVPTTSFPEHTAFIGSFSLTGRPWLKYRIRNGRRFSIPNSSPQLRLEYTKGFKELFNSAINFDRVEFGFKHQLRVGVRGTLFTSFRAGAFLNADSLGFMDYKHFIGNQTALMTTEPAGSFRLMDYYAFSTKDKYFEANTYYQFRKFLVTTLPYTRILGIRESIFANYLATPLSKNYVELGYAVEGILRLFRVEVAAAFRDGRYMNYGVRIGIATTLTTEFSDN